MCVVVCVSASICACLDVRVRVHVCRFGSAVGGPVDHLRGNHRPDRAVCHRAERHGAQHPAPLPLKNTSDADKQGEETAIGGRVMTLGFCLGSFLFF